jgi:hypothetical protein
MTATSEERRFRVGLSFADASRDYVRGVARALVKALGERRVLFDENFEAEFAVPGLGTRLPLLYRDQSDLIVVFLCASYQTRHWCRLEWRAIRELIETVDAGRIMLIELEDPGDLSDLGIYRGDGVLKRTGRSAGVLASKILERLAIVDAGPGGKPKRRKKVAAGQAAVDEARATLTEWLVATLGAAPGAAAALATELLAQAKRLADRGKTGGVPRRFEATGAALAAPLVEALLACRAVTVAAALNQAHRHAGRSDKEVLAAVMFRILPFAADLDEVRRRAQAEVDGGAVGFELPCRGEVLADVISAGIDGLPIEVTGGDYPAPVHALSAPPSAYAPVFGGAAIVEEVAQQLAHDARPENAVFEAHARRLSRTPVVLGATRALLEEAAIAGGRVRYMVFVDELVSRDGTASPDELWTVIVGAVGAPGTGLPGLRLVRLTGGEAEIERDTKIAFHVAQVRNRRGV